MTTETRTSPKKARKPQARSLFLRDAILAIAGEYGRLSVRQLFYQLVARRVIDKTEQAYKRVCDASVQLRLAGELPYGKIADGHRTRRAVFQHGALPMPSRMPTPSTAATTGSIRRCMLRCGARRMPSPG